MIAAEIAENPDVPPPTVSGILTWIGGWEARPRRSGDAERDERARLGELLHIDVK
jgi:hypothetical protein